MMYAAIGSNIRALRREKKLTQEQLAELADISPSFLGHIERGTRQMSVETLYRIADALECTPGDVLGSGGPSQEMKLSALLYRAAKALEAQGK